MDGWICLEGCSRRPISPIVRSPVRPEVSKDGARSKPVTTTVRADPSTGSGQGTHSVSKPFTTPPFGLSLSKPCVYSGCAHSAEFRCRSVAAAGDLLFFASPKKSKQKKGDPAVCVPPLRYGQPALLTSSGALLELATLRQSRALIHLKLRSSAHTEGFCGEGFGFGVRFFRGWRCCIYSWGYAGTAACAD